MMRKPSIVPLYATLGALIITTVTLIVIIFAVGAVRLGL